MPIRKQSTNSKLQDWLLRSLLVIGQRSQHKASAGFVLPTVVMVSLVVVLLTTAMMLRSFDRSKNASNFRVNETVLNASSPALDRARLKIDALFADPALPRGTPSEAEMYNAIASKDRYTFGDEDRLKVAYDINGGGISTTGALQDQEVKTTAWRFPIDTDNNGKYDSYTLYGIYLRSPSVGANGQFNRARNPLEARSAPMTDDRTLGSQCKNAFGGPTTSTFLSSTGWYRVNDVLKKSFFVYTATVPLTGGDAIVGSNPSRYEAYKGNKGFSALELQQDRSRLPIYNAAVLYEDDLEVTPGPKFQLNGRVFTNSNLLTGKDSGDIRFFQISSTSSCYIQNEENSKIVVGGNVGFGSFTGGSTTAGVRVDLKQGNTIDADSITNTRKTVDAASTDTSYNSQAYTERIDLLVRSAILRSGTQTVGGTYPNQTVTSNDPAEVKSNIASRLNSNASLDPAQVRQEELERYFRQRTRRVPYKEVPFGTSIIGSTVNGVTIADTTPVDGIADAATGIFPNAGALRTPDAWAMPTAANGLDSTGYTGLELKTDGGSNMEFPMTEPEKRRTQYNREERRLGDRIFVGNNLPFLRYLASSNSFIGSRTQQLLQGKTWNDGPGTRYRETRIEELPDLGVTNRNGFWEKSATDVPVNALDNVGGLRVITGAGIYFNPTSTVTTNISAKSWFEDRTFGRPNPFRAAVGTVATLITGEPAPLVSRDVGNLAGTVSATTRYSIVWPDSMPMTPGEIAGSDTSTTPVAVTTKPDLRMRATAVYHYQDSTGIAQAPIACVSSYHDPTNETTAKNQVNVNSGFGIDTTNGKSNNGVVYPRPYDSDTGRFSAIGTYIAELKAQAQMMFPNGRIVNEPLQNALKKLTASGTLVSNSAPLSLEENAAIDTAICAIKILDGTIGSATTTPASRFTIPHGAIREVSFLDGRQVKAIDSAQDLLSSGASSTTTSRTYTMSETGNLAKGDVVTIGGFKDNPATTANEAELNVTRGTITAITSDSSITVSGGTTSAMTSPTGSSGKVLEALTGDYDLALEERQPLEVRATEIDLSAIKTAVSGASPNEYLFPNSGIIYASRDDALLDLSGPLSSSSAQDKASQKLSSPVDYRLDPSRRPSSILLKNGSTLGRQAAYRPEEKGLVLATNLPVYIKGDFNLHNGEEFGEALAVNWEDNFYSRSTLNENFACRTGQYAECTTGDPWRPATVLADAITPLSEVFRYGFRNEGDYDLSDQVGSLESITRRRTNAFWNNAFAVNGLSSGGITVDGSTPTDIAYRTATASAVNSSYFNNFVTPVQRRGTFSEYVMETCRKVPVSACTPNDWVVGFDINGNGTLDAGVILNGVTYNEKLIKANQLGKVLKDLGKAEHSTGLVKLDGGSINTVGGAKVDKSLLGAGTTAQPALVAEDRRYARRISFARNLQRALVFTEVPEPSPSTTKNPAARPIGIGCALDASGSNYAQNGCVYPSGSDTVSAGTHYANTADNALWFRTTTNTIGKPGDTNGITYENDRPLYYLPPELGGSKLILPDIPEIPGVDSLNLPAGDQSASDYLICSGNAGSGNVSNAYSIASGANFPTNNCPQGARDAITAALPDLMALPPTGTIAVTTATIGSLTTRTYTAQATSSINVFALPTGGTPDIPNGSKIVIDANGDENAVFVLKGTLNGGFAIGSNNCSSGSTPDCRGVEVVLQNGANPNNIIWAVGGQMAINDIPSPNQHILYGNFVAGSGFSKLGNNTIIPAGRILGAAQIASGNIGSGVSITAVTADAQPQLIPVLQLQVTTATASDSTTKNTTTNLPTGTNSEVGSTKWLPTANVETTFNLVAAAGDTPARPIEDNGGLHNFLRFVEMWSGTNVKAFGSFVQYKRSVFATAPWQPLISSADGGTGGTIGGLFDYQQAYQTTNSDGKVPFYKAPNRRWGFDVALLKQVRPDLLAERFSTEPVLSANEFFREVPRNDAWVTSLMCAKVVSNGSNAVNNTERPANCPTGSW